MVAVPSKSGGIFIQPMGDLGALCPSSMTHASFLRVLFGPLSQALVYSLTTVTTDLLCFDKQLYATAVVHKLPLIIVAKPRNSLIHRTICAFKIHCARELFG